MGADTARRHNKAKTAEICAFQKLARILLLYWQARQRANATIKVQDTTMTYQAANFRNAFIGITFALLASAVFVAGAVGPAVIA